MPLKRATGMAYSNILYLITAALQHKEAISLLNMPEGTYKKKRNIIYKTMGEDRSTRLIKRCEREGWFLDIWKFLLTASAFLVDGIPCLA